MEWYRRYSDRTSNARLFRAGFVGTLVFDALCDLCCERDFGGDIPRDAMDFDLLAYRMGLTRAIADGVFGPDQRDGVGRAREMVESGLSACFRAGLVSETGGVITIVGWVERQPKLPQSSTERVQKHREKLNLALFGNEMERGNVSVNAETDIESKSKKESKSKSFPAKEPDGMRALSDRMCSEYEARRKDRCIWTKADGIALAYLMKVSTPEKILEKWILGITSTDKWLRISSAKMLRMKWNDLAGLKAVSKPQLEDFTDKDPYAH